MKRLKYTLLLLFPIWHSQKMNRKVSYTHQYLSRTETIYLVITFLMTNIATKSKGG